MSWTRVRQKPHVVETFQYHGDPEQLSLVGDWGWAPDRDFNRSMAYRDVPVVWNKKRGRWLLVYPTNWLVRDTDGVVDVFSSEIFEQTYEADDSPPSQIESPQENPTQTLIAFIRRLATYKYKGGDAFVSRWIKEAQGLVFPPDRVS